MGVNHKTGITYYLNDNYFNEKSLQSCYFAGLLAADGCCFSNSNSIAIGLQRQDKYILEKFAQEMNSNYIIKDKIEKEKFYSSVFYFTSKQIKTDLDSIYNIVSKKSLTLQPPNLNRTDEIDAFICGYIDGDGSIFQSIRKNRKQGEIIFSILGTLEMLTWIQNRFKSILKKEVSIIKRKRNNGKNTFVLIVSTQKARNLFIHFYKIPVEKLKRKWKTEYYEFCSNYMKESVFVFEDKKSRYLKMIQEGLDFNQIAQIEKSKYIYVQRFCNKNFNINAI